MDNSSCIIPALDKMDLARAITLVEALSTRVLAFKLHALADRELTAVIANLAHYGARGIWVDYKLCDTPDTVAERATKIREAGATMLTVHAGGGPNMVEAAVKNGPPFIIAVTLLTSLTDEMVRKLYRQEPEQVVRKLALWAKEGGAHAIVCAPTQVGNLSAMSELTGMKFIVPGTRSAGATTHDQQQVDTPHNAILNGADFLVGGRQITQAQDPLAALEAMAAEIAPAIEARKAAGTWKD